MLQGPSNSFAACCFQNFTVASALLAVRQVFPSGLKATAASIRPWCGGVRSEDYRGPIHEPGRAALASHQQQTSVRAERQRPGWSVHMDWSDNWPVASRRRHVAIFAAAKLFLG